jgi:hypothetical protein
MIDYKGIAEFGALYKNRLSVERATRPWIIDLSTLIPYDGIEPGNIADFSAFPDWSRWHIGDTPSTPEHRLRWIVLEDRERRLFICDRVILVRVSWQDLDSVGLVEGTKIDIDGSQYICRLMTGGRDFRVPEDGHSGGSPSDNEWDLIVAGEQAIQGLPVPDRFSVDRNLNETDRLGLHNQMWNWFGVVSWTAMPFARRESARCCRGYHSASYFYLNTFNHRHEDIGWRPVLEGTL